MHSGLHSQLRAPPRSQPCLQRATPSRGTRAIAGAIPQDGMPASAENARSSVRLLTPNSVARSRSARRVGGIRRQRLRHASRERRFQRGNKQRQLTLVRQLIENDRQQVLRRGGVAKRLRRGDVIDDRAQQRSHVEDHDAVRLRDVALRRIARFAMYIVRACARGSGSMACLKPAGIHAAQPAGTVQAPKLFDTEKVPNFDSIS